MAASHNQSVPALMARRPDAKAFKIENLLVEVGLGHVRIPSFQRKLKWTRDDAQHLIDSIYRGYPIGTLLLWETDAPAAEISFGSVVIDAPARGDALWVVDGQQRIVSLVRMLLAQPPSDDAFALYFDLDEQRFVPPPAPEIRMADAPRWLPLTEILDSGRLIDWILAHQDTPARKDAAIAVGKRVREYDMPAYIVRTGDEETLREIFGRINNSGKRLERDEVFDALHGARSASRPATIDQIAEQLQALGFGRVENKILYRLLRVLQGADITEPSRDTLRLTPEQAGAAYRDTARVAASVIQFLKKDGGIPHYALLPYKQPLVTLGKFFSLHPQPAPRSRDLLVRWLWRGALNGSHKGDTASSRRALELIVDSDEEGSVQRMLEMVGQPAPPPATTDAFNFRFAASKLQTLALLDLSPLDLMAGERVRLAALSDGEEARNTFVLPAIVGPTGQDGLLHSVANRLAHPPGSLRRLLLSTTDQRVLDSHGVTAGALAALRGGDWLQFLTDRALLLEKKMDAFFARMARPEEDDRPSLRALLVEDE